MRVRITIEYDPDWPDNTDVSRQLEQEKIDWRDGSVSIGDIETIGYPNGSVKWELIR